MYHVFDAVESSICFFSFFLFIKQEPAANQIVAVLQHFVFYFYFVSNVTLLLGKWTIGSFLIRMVIPDPDVIDGKERKKEKKNNSEFSYFGLNITK